MQQPQLGVGSALALYMAQDMLCIGVNSRKRQRAQPDVLVVGPTLCIPLGGVHAALKPWLVEVWLIHKDQGLDGDEHLHSMLSHCT